MASPSTSSSDTLPSAEALSIAAGLEVLDREGKALPFQSLYSSNVNPAIKKRVLVIFVRRFFCGNRRTYPQMVSTEIQPDMLDAIDTSIAVVGYGSPALIDEYAQMTGCPYPIYADPSGALFDALGLIKSWSKGASSEQDVQNLLMAFFNGFWPVMHDQSEGQQQSAKATGSDPTQLSGEFLFEPLPAAAASSSAAPSTASGRSGYHAGGQKYVTWCYRMRTSQGNTDIPGIKQVLGL